MKSETLTTPEIERIGVIGCGGIGLCVLPVLARYVNYHPEIENVDIVLIDGDKFEPKNQDRQFFKELGNKAEITAQQFQEEYKNIYFNAVGEYLTPGNIGTHIREGDVIFMCVDNHSTRKLVIEEFTALQNGILISGGNDYYDGNVSVYIRVDGEDKTLPPTTVYPEIANPPEKDKNPGEIDAEREGGCAIDAESAPQLLITNNAIAATMLNAFLSVVEGKHGVYGDIYVDALSNKMRHNDRAMPRQKAMQIA